jgi:hypothetical protein
LYKFTTRAFFRVYVGNHRAIGVVCWNIDRKRRGIFNTYLPLIDEELNRAALIGLELQMSYVV